MEGEEEPTEIRQLKRDLETTAKDMETASQWLARAMEQSWGIAGAAAAFPALADLLGERHRIIANDWQAAKLQGLIARLLQRSLDLLNAVDLSPDALRLDLDGDRTAPGYLFSASELIDHATDLMAELGDPCPRQRTPVASLFRASPRALSRARRSRQPLTVPLWTEAVVCIESSYSVGRAESGRMTNIGCWAATRLNSSGGAEGSTGMWARAPGRKLKVALKDRTADLRVHFLERYLLAPAVPKNRMTPGSPHIGDPVDAASEHCHEIPLTLEVSDHDREGDQFDRCGDHEPRGCAASWAPCRTTPSGSRGCSGSSRPGSAARPCTARHQAGEASAPA